LDNLEEVTRLHNFLMQLSDSKEINRVTLNTLIQLLESSKIDIQAKLVSPAGWHTTSNNVDSQN